jgi:hypothetical protein
MANDTAPAFPGSPPAGTADTSVNPAALPTAQSGPVVAPDTLPVSQVPSIPEPTKAVQGSANTTQDIGGYTQEEKNALASIGIQAPTETEASLENDAIKSLDPRWTAGPEALMKDPAFDAAKFIAQYDGNPDLQAQALQLASTVVHMKEGQSGWDRTMQFLGGLGDVTGNFLQHPIDNTLSAVSGLLQGGGTLAKDVIATGGTGLGAAAAGAVNGPATQNFLVNNTGGAYGANMRESAAIGAVARNQLQQEYGTINNLGFGGGFQGERSLLGMRSRDEIATDLMNQANLQAAATRDAQGLPDNTNISTMDPQTATDYAAKELATRPDPNNVDAAAGWLDPKYYLAGGLAAKVGENAAVQAAVRAMGDAAAPTRIFEPVTPPTPYMKHAMGILGGFMGEGISPGIGAGIGFLTGEGLGETGLKIGNVAVQRGKQLLWNGTRWIVGSTMQNAPGLVGATAAGAALGGLGMLGENSDDEKASDLLQGAILGAGGYAGGQLSKGFETGFAGNTVEPVAQNVTRSLPQDTLGPTETGKPLDQPQKVTTQIPGTPSPIAQVGAAIGGLAQTGVQASGLGNLIPSIVTRKGLGIGDVLQNLARDPQVGAGLIKDNQDLALQVAAPDPNRQYNDLNQAGQALANPQVLQNHVASHLAMEGAYEGNLIPDKDYDDLATSLNKNPNSNGFILDPNDPLNKSGKYQAFTRVMDDGSAPAQGHEFGHAVSSDLERFDKVASARLDDHMAQDTEGMASVKANMAASDPKGDIYGTPDSPEFNAHARNEYRAEFLSTALEGKVPQGLPANAGWLQTAMRKMMDRIGYPADITTPVSTWGVKPTNVSPRIFSAAMEARKAANEATKANEAAYRESQQNLEKATTDASQQHTAAMTRQPEVPPELPGPTPKEQAAQLRMDTLNEKLRAAKASGDLKEQKLAQAKIDAEMKARQAEELHQAKLKQIAETPAPKVKAPKAPKEPVSPKTETTPESEKNQENEAAAPEGNVYGEASQRLIKQAQDRLTAAQNELTNHQAGLRTSVKGETWEEAEAELQRNVEAAQRQLKIAQRTAQLVPRNTAPKETSTAVKEEPVSKAPLEIKPTPKKGKKLPSKDLKEVYGTEEKAIPTKDKTAAVPTVTDAQTATKQLPPSKRPAKTIRQTLSGLSPNPPTRGLKGGAEKLYPQTGEMGTPHPVADAAKIAKVVADSPAVVQGRVGSILNNAAKYVGKHFTFNYDSPDTPKGVDITRKLSKEAHNLTKAGLLLRAPASTDAWVHSLSFDKETEHALPMGSDPASKLARDTIIATKKDVLNKIIRNAKNDPQGAAMAKETLEKVRKFEEVVNALKVPGSDPTKLNEADIKAHAHALESLGMTPKDVAYFNTWSGSKFNYNANTHFLPRVAKLAELEPGGFWDAIYRYASDRSPGSQFQKDVADRAHNLSIGMTSDGRELLKPIEKVVETPEQLLKKGKNKGQIKPGTGISETFLSTDNPTKVDRTGEPIIPKAKADGLRWQTRQNVINLLEGYNSKGAYHTDASLNQKGNRSMADIAEKGPNPLIKQFEDAVKAQRGESNFKYDDTFESVMQKLRLDHLHDLPTPIDPKDVNYSPVPHAASSANYMAATKFDNPAHDTPYNREIQKVAMAMNAAMHRGDKADYVAWKKDYANLMNPNFRNWFGQGKVVDEQGIPKVMYHGTPNPGHNVFDPEVHSSGQDVGPLATYLSTSPDHAEQYAGRGSTEEEPGGGIYPVHTRVKNIFQMEDAHTKLPDHQIESFKKAFPEVDPKEKNETAYDIDSAIANIQLPVVWTKVERAAQIKSLGRRYTNWLLSEGYDAWQGPGIDGLGVLKSEDMKSVIGNGGEYGENPNIIQ